MVGNFLFTKTFKTMKKHISYILFFLITSLIGLGSCSDDKSDLNLSGGVRITSITANGVEGIIGETTKPSTVEFYLPWSYDLKNLTVDSKLSEGATVTPSLSGQCDFSTAATYQVINGNLYNNYSISASYSKFLTFSIGSYSGTIDNDNRTITIKYPMGEDVTALRPAYTLTTGATATPNAESTSDFTNPVDYTLSFMGESVNYIVTVIPTNFTPVGFLGTAATAAEIADEDEKAAYTWFSKNNPTAEYISFSGIQDGSVILSTYSVLWWHLDGSSNNLPTAATSNIVLTAIKNYYENGGSLFLSSWAVKYAPLIGATSDNKEVNNVWGESNGDEAVTLGEDWGINFTGHENHPIFEGLSKPAGTNNKVFLLSTGLKVKAHNAIWNFAESWVEYKSKDAWQTGNGGIGLGSFHWDNNNNERSVMFEYPKTDTKGGVICIGSEAYDWYVIGTNKYQNNLEKLTSNIIEYLQD